MVNLHHPKDVLKFNENSLQELIWAIATSQGEFSLILALCNSPSLQKLLVKNLRVSCSQEIREIVLDRSVKIFYTDIRCLLGEEHPQALIVLGLESVSELEDLLIAANSVREELRKNFPFPLVLWITDEILHKLMRLATDLQSWATTVEFAIATDDLINFIQQTADEVFEQVLAARTRKYLDNTALNLQSGSSRRVELESAWYDLQNGRLSLNPELEASLEFMLGRATSDSMEQSRQHYERSLALFNQDSPSLRILERQACLLYSLGLWWRTYAVLHHSEQEHAFNLAKDYFQQCIELFEQANRKDLVAKFINVLGSVLQSLKSWQELETVAKRALALHKIYPNQFKTARAYGFLAEVAIAKSAWTEAQEAAAQALFILDSVRLDTLNPVPEEIKEDLEWENSSHRGWYLFALARSQSALNQPQAALQTLEIARAKTKAQYNPELYIRILTELHNSYFQERQYLKAFNIKQDQRSIKQQYGFLAFIGTGRLKPQKQVNTPDLPFFEQKVKVATEIADSGRQQDINHLIERISRPDYKLTVIYGQSGVGKSSILQAGLIPALKQKSIGTRDVLPVLQQVYTDWTGELYTRLQNAIKEIKHYYSINSAKADINFTKAILNKLRKHDNDNLLTILIFDQFEEFFFVYKDPKDRQKFYEFLRECLNIMYVKVILALREDYLHYLLECNRLVNIEVIDNNILDKHNLYYLNNFSPVDAKTIIQTLTKKTQLILESSLIDELVNDLSRDLGEVRPIELQVVGAQIQTEKITKLEQYRQYGPKENFVWRFLEEIVKDCGSENEQIAKLVLYLLTDENNTRPLKTRAELKLELDVKLDLDVKAETLDLVLEILVRSGLVLRVPASPTNHYQLVHDYLLPFVRQQQQSARLIAELEKEKEQRQLTEAELSEVLKQSQVLNQKLIKTRKGMLQQAILIAITAGLAIILLINQNNAELIAISTESQFLLKSNQDVDALIQSLKAGKKLQDFWSVGVQSETRIKVLTALQDAVYGFRKRNILDGYTTNFIRCFSFSPNGQMLISGDANGLLKIWSRDGKNLQTFKAHDKGINSVSFSPDNQKIASGSDDKTVKLWSINGKEISTFKGNQGSVTSISFSPDGKLIASASQDNTVKIWQLDGSLLETFNGHSKSVNSVTFSPDGKLIASASDDKTVKLWQLNGTIIKTFDRYRNGVNSVSFSPNGKMIAFGSQGKTGTIISLLDSTRAVKVYDAESINSISFSPDSQIIASASKKTVKLWNIDGTLLTNFQRFGSYDVSFSPDGKSIAAIGNGKILVWDFDLNELLKRGCNAAHDYLKNNPKVESDRSLCDDIYTNK
ncbi:nSTAND1 domain-containing NTPase [Nostoc sp.]|uniref:nSTAND1 domain-containing NTPase n=1 Tax=Nostoc sp. TaxID=1180 RepID=UPI002FF4F0C3